MPLHRHTSTTVGGDGGSSVSDDNDNDGCGGGTSVAEVVSAAQRQRHKSVLEPNEVPTLLQRGEKLCIGQGRATNELKFGFAGRAAWA